MNVIWKSRSASLCIKHNICPHLKQHIFKQKQPMTKSNSITWYFVSFYHRLFLFKKMFFGKACIYYVLCKERYFVVIRLHSIYRPFVYLAICTTSVVGKSDDVVDEDLWSLNSTILRIMILLVKLSSTYIYSRTHVIFILNIESLSLPFWP